MSATQTARDQIAFLRRLRTVRDFRPDPLPQEVIDDILEVARWTGSASNKQPWELVVVRDRETLRRLASLDGSVKHLAAAPLGIVLVMAGERDETETYDDGRLTERIMLAAAAHGLGSCIGWWTANARNEAGALLGVPEDRIVRTVLSIGYPDEETRHARAKNPEARKPIADFVHHERFG